MVDAVKAGKFTIYPINRAEEGLEILTGMSAGELKEDGTYPERHNQLPCCKTL